MHLDALTRQAIEHTAHCLLGCGIGEISGMLIATSLSWPRPGRLTLAIILAFVIGYSLTYRGVRQHSATATEAFRVTLTTDTVSIVTMELIDNLIELVIPNALSVTATSFRFWWSLALSLMIAFVVTIPLNRYLISKSPH